MPRPTGIERRALVRESLAWSMPAALVLAGLAALSVIGIPVLLAGWLAALVIAGILAWRRLATLERIGGWIEELARRGSLASPPEASGPVADRLRLPLGELGRRLRRLEDALTARQRTLATLVEALPDPILVVDRERNVVRCNSAARRSFDAPSPPVPLARLVRDPGVLASVEAALSGTATRGFTFRPTHDLTKQFTCRIEPVELGEDGRGVLIALRERTEQVMIERMRSDFVANASHELRTPLASLQGFIETLRGPARDDPAARESFLAIMAEEAARMSRLIDDLLSLSRIELAAHQPPRERCAPAAVLEQALARMEPGARAARVRLVRQIGSSLPEVVGDPDQLQQLFVNLIDNAIKYGGEGQTVRVTAEALAVAPPEAGPLAGRPAVRIAVVDQGPGIAREHLPRLTERFYRVDTKRSRSLRGTGLGLAIVKHILRRHQGHLVIASELGRGSTFTALLPTAER